MLRVLQLGKFYDPFVGGIETVLKSICDSLSGQVQCQVLVANTRFRTEHDFRNVPVIRAASLGTWLSCSMAPSYPLWARKLSADCDLMHVHLPNPLAELSALLADRRVPAIAHFHSDIVRQRRLLKVYGPFLHALYRRVSRIIVPSPNHIAISRFVSQYRDKCRVVSYGIPLARFDLDEAGRQRADQLRDGRPALLYVGRLVYYKGLDFLIRALARLEVRLWIVGTGPLETSLKALAEHEGIADRVEFLGELPFPELLARYHACELFVLPSVGLGEMFGMVQLEAMACRKPVISTNLPTGVSWVNLDGVTGYTVPPGSVDELAGPIRRLLSDPKLRADMGQAGRERVESLFTSEKMAAGLLQVYEEVGQAGR
jgi:rhamnosyl/mannosyltransferase